MVDALKEQEADRKAKGEPARPPLYHMEANTWIEFIDKDHARYHAYYLTLAGAGGANVPARIAAAGRSVNHLERVNGKWLIKLRDVTPQN
jgi:SnoaL-like protein